MITIIWTTKDTLPAPIFLKIEVKINTRGMKTPNWMLARYGTAFAGNNAGYSSRYTSITIRGKNN